METDNAKVDPNLQFMKALFELAVHTGVMSSSAEANDFVIVTALMHDLIARKYGLDESFQKLLGADDVDAKFAIFRILDQITPKLELDS